MHSGVYEIVNKATGKRYVGSAKRFKSRWKAHVTELRGNRHHAPYLQRSWNKYGEDAFEFRKLLVCSRQNLLLYEQILMDGLNPEYNVCKVAGSRLGVRLTRAQVNAKLLTYNGTTKSIREWANEYGVPITTFHNRLTAGWAFERALTTPVLNVNSKAFFDARREKLGQPVYDYKGQKLGLVDLSRALGIDKGQLWSMLRKRGPEGAIAYYEAVAEGNRPKTLRNVVCEYNGKPQSLLTLCEEFNAPYPTLSRRVKRYGLEETIKYYEAKRA